MISPSRVQPVKIKIKQSTRLNPDFPTICRNLDNHQAMLWAILVGIDFYANQNSLQGAVQDIRAVKRYLEGFSRDIAQIITLTASKSLDANQESPPEDPQSRPTWLNLKAALNHVLQSAQPGHSVLLHYSGHGTRIETTGHPDGLALVLYDEKFNRQKCVRGNLVARFMKQFTDAGLHVTLVLDCCYSGGAQRVESNVRSIPYNPLTMELVDEDGVLPSNGTLRHAQLSPDPDGWLQDPEGYTIFAACGPQEESWEIDLDSKGRRGALSYFLYEALANLKRRQEYVSQQALYNYVRARFRACWPVQTPMRFGKLQELALSMNGGASSGPVVDVYRDKDGVLMLDAGRLHGVEVGDEYSVRGFGRTHQGEILGSLRVDSVHSFKSTVTEVWADESLKHDNQAWKAQWTARRDFALKKIIVAMDESTAKYAAPSRISDRCQFLRICQDESQKGTCTLHVRINELMDFEILDAKRHKIINLPKVPIDIPGAAELLGGLLRHMATFKYFESLEADEDKEIVGNIFDMSITSTCDATGTYSVKHGSSWKLQLENKGPRDLYFSIFDFTPSWGIVNLAVLAGGNEYQVLEAKSKGSGSKVSIDIDMSVPKSFQEKAERQCEDVFKIIITSQPTVFPLMTLPDISPELELGSKPEDIPSTGRGYDLQQSAQEFWFTRSVVVRTFME